MARPTARREGVAASKRTHLARRAMSMMGSSRLAGSARWSLFGSTLRRIERARIGEDHLFERLFLLATDAEHGDDETA
jgi:hypothetical protein